MLRRLRNKVLSSAAAAEPTDAVALLTRHLAIDRSLIPQFLDIEGDLDELAECLIDRDMIAAILVNAIKAPNGSFQNFFYEIANTLLNCGHVEISSKYFRRAIEMKPNPIAHTAYLQSLMLSPAETNTSLLEAHREWARLYEAPKLQSRAFANSPDPERPLRIGYICGFLGASTMRYGPVEMIRRHNSDAYSVFIYSDGDIDEEKPIPSATWRNTANLTDLELAELIRSDEIDILQELNGHCVHSRYGALINRAAPIQINWANYTSTTGLESVDWTISDEISIAAGDEALFTENVYRCSQYMGTAAFGERDFEDCAEAPISRNGFATFGYFGSVHKVQKSTIELWAGVLKELPTARFIFKSGGLDHDLIRRNFLRLFEEAQVEASRIEFRGFSPHEQMLREYGDVDMMLDGTGHTGGATMFEALWMGLPAVTLSGHRWSMRNGAAMLAAAGLPDLISDNRDEYIRKAVAWGSNTTKIQNYRSSARQQLMNSALYDIDRVCRDMEKAYRDIWVDWCASAQH